MTDFSLQGILRAVDPAPTETGKYELVDLGVQYPNLIPVIYPGQTTPSNTPITTDPYKYNAVYFDGTNFTLIQTYIVDSTIKKWSDEDTNLFYPSARSLSNNLYRVKTGEEATSADIPSESNKWEIIGLDSAIINNDEFMFGIVDKEQNIVFGIRYDGTLFNLDPTLSNLKKHPAFSNISIISDQEFIFALLDRDNKVLFGKRYDGTTYDSDNTLKELINQIKNRKDDVFYTSNPLPTTEDIVRLTEGSILVNTTDGQPNNPVIQKAKFINGKLSSWYLPEPVSSLHKYYEVISNINENRRDIIEFAVNKESLVNKNSVIGFLHQRLGEEAKPFEDQLEISLVRHGSEIFYDETERNKYIGRALEAGSQVVYVLSDLIAQCDFTEDPDCTYINETNFDDLCEHFDWLYDVWGNQLIYDIWNEPDNWETWHFDEDNHNDIFNFIKRIYCYIRSKEDGDSIKIMAPSTYKFNLPYIQKFLDFCRANGMVINYLAWHHLDSGALNITRMEQDIKDILALAEEYKDVVKDGVMCPEILNFYDTTLPSAALLQLALLEKYNILTCKACWIENGIDNTCRNSSLNGLLSKEKVGTEINFYPRAIWYAYKFYSESLKRRGRTIKSNNLLGGVSWVEDDIDNKTIVHAILGSYEEEIIQNFPIYFSYLNTIFGNDAIVNIEINEYWFHGGYEAFDEADDIKPVLLPKKSILKNGGILVEVIPMLRPSNLYKIKITN